MRISQRLDYTLRMLVALARVPDGATVASGDLVLRLGLPRRFAEQQMTALAKAGLVESRRGTGGGNSLARPAREITVLEVVRAIQGESLDVPHSTGSATAEFWGRLAASVDDILAGTTLADLSKRQTELDVAAGPMYFI